MMSSEPTTYKEQFDVSKVETSKIQSQATGSDVRRIFGDLTNCSIGSITINVSANTTTDPSI